MLPGLLAALALPHLVSGPFPIEDTYLDAQVPDSNFGRDGLLLTGTGTAILLRFPALNWIRPDESIETATLTFTMAEPATIALKSVSRVLVPWSEGSELRLPVAHPAQPDPQYRGGATWKARRYGPNGQKWERPGAAGEEDAVPVTGVNLVTEGSKVTLTGLGGLFNEIAKRPWNNYGVRLEFEGKGSFFSTEGVGPAPTVAFTTTTEPAKASSLAVLSLVPKGDPQKPTGWTARVQNIGDSVVTGVNAAWKIRHETKATTGTQQALAPGDTLNLDWDVSTAAERASPDVSPITVQVQSGGSETQSGPQASLTVPITGLPVRLALTDQARRSVDDIRGKEPVERFLQRLVTFINEGVLAQSRTSFAPEGCRERLRLVWDGPALDVSLDVAPSGTSDLFQALAKQVLGQVTPFGQVWATAPEAKPQETGHFGKLSDTRDDTGWPSTLMLPAFPWGEPKPLQAPLPERNLLSRAEIAALNELAGKPLADRSTYVPSMPGAAILSLADGAGNPIGGATVEVFQTNEGKLGTETVAKGMTTATGGKVFLAQREGVSPFGALKPDGSNSWFFVRVTKDFMTKTAWLPAWAFSPEAARGNVNAPSVELRLMMPSGALKLDEDLAQGKTASDSTGRFPAELAAVTDGDASSAVSLKPGQFLDIDLGRDRLIGAVEIETIGAPLEKFELSLAKTGQKPETGELWFKEARGSRRHQEMGVSQGGVRTIQYTSSAVRARYIRLRFVSGEDAMVAGVRVRTLQQG